MATLSWDDLDDQAVKTVKGLAADAVEKFLERDWRGIDNYMEHLESRNPFRQSP